MCKTLRQNTPGVLLYGAVGAAATAADFLLVQWVGGPLETIKKCDVRTENPL